MTPWQIESSLLERDLVLLLKYAEKRMLPTRRLQMQIARLCQISAGDPNKSLGDYLFDPPEPQAPGDAAQMAGETFADMAGSARVYVLGRKRKQRAA